MALTVSERHRRRLTVALRESGALTSDAVDRAFRVVARELFLPRTLAKEGLEAVYRDEAIVTKRDARGLPLSSSSQPTIMAKMLELLDVRPGDRVLEIGVGTGYNAALLSELAGVQGRVVSIDIDAELARRARLALREVGARVRVIVGDGRDIAVTGGLFDRIIVTASAAEIPSSWFEQLRVGGRLVVPLRLGSENDAMQVIAAFERHASTLRSVDLVWGAFMPLHAGDGGSQVPASSLSAVRRSNGRHTGLMSMTGNGISLLTASGARRLLASTLSTPARPWRSGVTALDPFRPPGLLLYLQLNIPQNRRVSLHHRERTGIGLVDRASQSAAIASLRTPAQARDSRTRTRWRLDTYSGDTAAAEVNELLNQWQRLERTTHPMPQITAHRRAGRLRLHFAWGE